MSSRSIRRLVREGDVAAEVDIELLESEGSWAPYVSLEDAYKLDDVREALRSGNLRRAAEVARLYRLSPVTEYEAPANKPMQPTGSAGG